MANKSHVMYGMNKDVLAVSSLAISGNIEALPASMARSKNSDAFLSFANTGVHARFITNVPINSIARIIKAGEDTDFLNTAL